MTGARWEVAFSSVMGLASLVLARCCGISGEM
jgi:hypothetical protein